MLTKKKFEKAPDFSAYKHGEINNRGMAEEEAPLM